MNFDLALHSDQYVAISRDELIEKLRKATDETVFTPPDFSKPFPIGIPYWVVKSAPVDADQPLIVEEK